jgi:hypothetical protein
MIQHSASTDLPSQSEGNRSPARLRPIHIVVVVWGEHFRSQFADFCLPTLLSPGNIPALSGGQRNKMVICTTPEDWKALERTAIFELLARHITPHFIGIPPPPPGRSGTEHMGVGHELATEMASREGAYGVFITPDYMLSDGTLARIEALARAGKRVVLNAAVRFGEEPLFANLLAMGLIREGEHLGALGRPLTITGRQLAAAAIRSFHSQTERFDWDAAYFTNFPSACWWRVPGEDGIVMHALSWSPLLLDYAAIGRHDTSVLANWTMDADYVYRNFGDGDGIYVVADSDEMMQVSWSPMANRPQSLEPSALKALPVVGEWIKGAIVRGALKSGFFDPLKQRMFFTPVRWHARDLSPAWHATEDRAARLLDRYVPDLRPAGAGTNRGPRAPQRAALGALSILGRVWIVTAELYEQRARLMARLIQALRGDREALARVVRRVRITWKRLCGVATNEG